MHTTPTCMYLRNTAIYALVNTQASRGGFAITFPDQDTSHQLCISSQNRVTSKDTHPPFPLSADQVLVLIAEFSFEIPYISQNDIKDRSKADVFTKLFAIGQSSWLIIQCVARTAHGLRNSNHVHAIGR